MANFWGSKLFICFFAFNCSKVGKCGHNDADDDYDGDYDGDDGDDGDDDGDDGGIHLEFL